MQVLQSSIGMMRRRPVRMASAVLLVCVSMAMTLSVACQSEQQTSGQLEVVATILPVADFVKNVGGERVDVTVMVPPGASPHSYEPVPSQMVAIGRAQAYFAVGSGVEFELMWMDKVIEANPDMLVVDCSEGVQLRGADPHIWNSPANAMIMVENICDGLIRVDPGHASFYTRNRDDYLEELKILDGYVHWKLDGFISRHFMVYHPSFDYFAAEYGLTPVVVEQEGKEPTPKILQDCIDKALQYNLRYIFVEPQFVTDDCETIAAEIGGQTAPMDPLPENYIANIGRIADALELEFQD